MRLLLKHLKQTKSISAPIIVKIIRVLSINTDDVYIKYLMYNIIKKLIKKFVNNNR